MFRERACPLCFTGGNLQCLGTNYTSVAYILFMAGRATHPQAGRGRRIIVIVLFLIGGFLLQAAVGYYLLYRSYVYDKLATQAGFMEWVTMDVQADQPQHIGSYSALGGQTQVMWSAEAKRFNGFVRAESRWGRWSLNDSWGWNISYYSHPNDIDRFRWLVPRSCDRLFITRDSEGKLAPNTPANTIVVYVACGWPMVSIAGIDRNTPTAAGDSWQTSGAHVIEVQRQSITGVRTERILLPLRPLLIGTLVNTLIFGAMLGFVFLLAVGGRRLWRYERGRCPRCAYDLRRGFSTGCPECGWGRIDQAGEEPAVCSTG